MFTNPITATLFAIFPQGAMLTYLITATFLTARSSFVVLTNRGPTTVLANCAQPVVFADCLATTILAHGALSPVLTEIRAPAVFAQAAPRLSNPTEF